MQLNGRNLSEDMTDIIIKKKNEVYVTVKAEPAICQELSDLFTFDVPGAKFMPQYRNKYWDGKIRLFSPATGEVYVGLVDKIASWAKKAEYTLEFENNEFYLAFLVFLLMAYSLPREFFHLSPDYSFCKQQQDFPKCLGHF